MGAGGVQPEAFLKLKATGVSSCPIPLLYYYFSQCTTLSPLPISSLFCSLSSLFLLSFFSLSSLSLCLCLYLSLSLSVSSSLCLSLSLSVSLCLSLSLSVSLYLSLSLSVSLCLSFFLSFFSDLLCRCSTLALFLIGKRMV
jgi:hypothetical protein